MFAIIAGCSSSKSPADPFVADVTTFCAAYEKHRPKSIAELGPKLAPELKDKQFIALFELSRDGDIARFLAGLDDAVKRAKLARCPTLDWMRSPMPPADPPP
jgi:hypothetical protein